MKRHFFPAILFFSCAGIVFLFCSWGFYAHETATQLAVYQLPKSLRRFFFSNIDSVTADAIRPDERRYTDKTEGPKHFIDLENYGNNVDSLPRDRKGAVAKYSSDTLKKYGYVPYQILIED